MPGPSRSGGIGCRGRTRGLNRCLLVGERSQHRIIELNGKADEGRQIADSNGCTVVVLKEAGGESRVGSNSDCCRIGGVAEHNPGVEGHQGIRIIDRVAGSGAWPLVTAPPVVGCVDLAVDIVDPSSRSCGVIYNAAEVDVEHLRAIGIHMNAAAVAGGGVSGDGYLRKRSYINVLIVTP